MPAAINELYRKITELEKKIADGTVGQKPEDDLLSIEQAAELLHLKKPTIYSMVSNGDVPYSKRRGRLYFSKAKLIEWATSSKAA